MDLVCKGIVLVVSLLSTIASTTAIAPPLLLTPYINENKTSEAKSLSAVNSSLFLNVPSHTGFLTINPELNSNTFFWYFPVQGQPVETTPWIIWLQGGPGVSSLAGLFNEIGPFEFKNGELKRRQYAWSHNYSMVFIDNPVGVGYSFTDCEEGFATDMPSYSSHLYSALQQFLTVFPELRKAPLFIAGESYAGRYVPGLAQKIMDAGQMTDQWAITLEGIIMGNPVLDRADEVNISDSFYQWGLIDSQGVEAVKPLQDLYANAVKKGSNELAKSLRSQLLDMLQDKTMQQQTYNLLADEYKLQEFEGFLGKEEVRSALHVGEVTFSFRNETVNKKLVPDFLTDASKVVQDLLNKYKVLIYCGQLDLTTPCVPNAEARRTKWRWNKREDFLKEPRVPWWYEESVAGYTKSGGGLEEALIRGAGHLAPIDKPAQVFKLVSSFIQNIEMDLPPNFSSKEDASLIPNKTDIPSTTTVTPVTTTTATIKTPIPTPAPNKVVTTMKPVQNSTKESTPSVASIVNVVASDDISAGTIVSVVLNVVLILIVAIGAFLYIRLKKRSEDFFYNNVENNSDDIFLT